ncbi:MAG: hypothetical protein PUF74_02675 [Sodaliphilus pleomorphus]|uniref:hypothetical protein n=1 Tax=Sodaliphilus pleomorphus TaxID=2606626 RepID=UPI002409C52F|nr:hypothetical protein [Sodaliphilus pleomorphus]MDD6474408.1 hypothetical protein [Sodaliphilus pleomorphus]
MPKKHAKIAIFGLTPKAENNLFYPFVFQSPCTGGFGHKSGPLGTMLAAHPPPEPAKAKQEQCKEPCRGAAQAPRSPSGETCRCLPTCSREDSDKGSQEAQLHGHCLPKKKEAPVARLLSVVFFKTSLKQFFYRIKISPVNF